MSAQPARQQNKLLPYLLVILVALLAYVVYTRLLAPSGPPAAVTLTPAPGAGTPSPGAAAPEATPAPEGSPAASPPPAVRIPPRPVGRANPFAALVTEQAPAATQPTPPPPPPAPPPFFPGGPTPPAGVAAGRQQAGGPRVAGLLFQDGSAMAIVELGQRTYIVREGDAVEEFRVERIEQGRVTLRRGQETVQLRLGGGEQP